MEIYKQFKNSLLFFGILKRFQWVGFLISTDNATWGYEYFLIEIRFLWVRFWYRHNLTTKNKK